MSDFELGPEYKLYINSAAWKAKSRLYWKVNGKFCRACGATNNLHVHHMSYEHFGREPLADLAGVCHTCHLQIHAQHRASGRRTSLRVVTLRYIKAKRLENARKRPQRR